MISTIIIWNYITVLSFIYGLLAIKISNKIFNFEKNYQVLSFPITSITGLCLISTLVGYLSLFIKIGLLANITLLAIGIIFTIIEYKNIINLVSTKLNQIKNTNKSIFLLFLITFLIVLIKTTSSYMISDTGGYHAQAIKWIEEYKAIPGLGNLHGRLAFNSTWFLPSALFSFSFLKLRSFHVLNGIFFLFGIIFSLSGLDKILKGNHSLCNITKTGVFLFLIYLFKKYLYAPSPDLSSPSPDMPTTLLIWILFIFFLDKAENNKLDNFDIQSVLVLIISSFALIIKLSALPIVILPMYIIYCEYSKGKKINMGSSLCIVSIIIIPWFIRNVILSGYLVYPFPSIDIFNFDWKIPIQRVILEKKSIESWARIPRLPSAKVLSMPFFNWLPVWFRSVSLKDKRILLIIITTSSFYITYMLFNLKRLAFWFNLYKKYAILYIGAYIGVLFWFTTAPDFRFGYGFLIILCLLLVIPLLKPLFTRLPRVLPILSLILLIVYQGATLYKSIEYNTSVIKHRILFPVNYKIIETKMIAQKNFCVYSPASGGQCWNTPLPCTPYPNSKLELRGDKIEDGFRISK